VICGKFAQISFSPIDLEARALTGGTLLVPENKDVRYITTIQARGASASSIINHPWKWPKPVKSIMLFYFLVLLY
jgi:hypothetical protein